MICTICNQNKDTGEVYTFSDGAKKQAQAWGAGVNTEPSFVCDDCRQNALSTFAETLLDMWAVFQMTRRQKIDSICQMFASGAVRLPRGVKMRELKAELKKAGVKTHEAVRNLRPNAQACRRR